MSRYTAPSDIDYYEEIEMPRRDYAPLAKVCVWCPEPHEYQAGAYPASHGLCPIAAAKQHALIEAEERARRESKSTSREADRS